MDAFINDTTFTRAVLFTNKMKTPILFQSLALQYSKRILLAEVKDSLTDVCSKYNIDKFPSVVVFNKDTTDPIVYDGKTNLLWLISILIININLTLTNYYINYITW